MHALCWFNHYVRAYMQAVGMVDVHIHGCFHVIEVRLDLNFHQIGGSLNRV